MAFDVAPIAESHIDGFRATVDAVARERRYLYFLEAPGLEDARKFVLNGIAKRYPHFVALEDGKVIGWCDVLPVDLRPLRAHTGTLGIGLLAQRRGRGVGSALLRETLKAARDFGFTRVELVYRAGNSRVGRLYERFGFVREGMQRNAVRLDGTYEDVICMALLMEVRT
ncbi:MAG TPA: GNAT family N-acetyltransferase [Burkholderiales bacterium]